MNKHILLYTDDPGLGGVAQYNHSLLCGLTAFKYRLTCVQSQISNPLVNYRQRLGIQHRWLDFDTSKDFERTLTNSSDALNIFLSIRPDIIIFSDSWPLANFAAKQAAMELKIPYIVVVNFVAPYPGELPSNYLDGLSSQYTRAKVVIAVSYENLNLLHTLFGLPPDKGHVIYYGRPAQYFDTLQISFRESLRREFGIPDDAIVCFTAARLDPIKGYQYQLAAIEQLKEKQIWDRLYFIWAGTGKIEEQLKQYVNELGVSNQVKILGQRWDIVNWLDASDIFVLPSISEGMPLAIMEAMAKGLAVIASAVSGIPEELDNNGKLLPDPKIDPQMTINELVATIERWSADPEARYLIGQACKTRAEKMFKEERMIQEINNLIKDSLSLGWDYVSPEFELICPDSCFPNMVVGDTSNCFWPYLRREIPHNWYVDRREPTIGFLNRDEVHILYNTALKFQGKRTLEIGCWLGWSACHLALAGVELDVVAPLLSQPDFYESVSDSLQAAGVLDSVNLVAGYSPQKIIELANCFQRKWSLIFIDGNHDAPAPLNDAIICEQYAEEDALILFHDLASPDVAQGLEYLRQKGWKTMVYQTMQIMAVAWRGDIEPVMHEPDPEVNWQLPSHLRSYPVSNRQSEQSINESCTNQSQLEFSNIEQIHNELLKSKFGDSSLNIDTKAAPKKVLVFFPHNPWPPRNGAHQRCLAMLSGLKELEYEIILFSSTLFTDNIWNTDSIEELQKNFGINVEVYQGTQADRQFMMQMSQNSQGLLNWKIYTPPGFSNRFHQLFTQLAPDIVLISYALWGGLAIGDEFKSALRIIDVYDLVTLNIQKRQALAPYLTNTSVSLEKIDLELVEENFFSKLQIDALADEYRIYDQYDYTVAISPYEVSEIQKHTQQTVVEYVPMVFTPEELHNTYTAPPLFLAGPNLFNVQGYLYFIIKVLPIVLAQLPNFNLHVVGASCQALVAVNGVNLLGFVPELKSLYAKGQFAVCPLIGGTGQQVKIVEAMAYGLPVIALQNVAESSPIQHGINGFIAEDAEEFARYTIQLFQDRELCRQLGQAAQKTISKSFSKTRLVEKLKQMALHRCGINRT